MLAFFSALLQVNEDLKTIGALAGLAAVPGLAVLSLLYFGQAREVRRLREWAGRAPERAAELEQRVSDEAARRVQGQPVPRPATQAATPAGQAATAAPATPGGNGVAKQAPSAQPATVAAQAATAGAAAAPAKPGEGEKPANGEQKKDEAEKPAEDKAAVETAKPDGETKPDEKKPDAESKAETEGKSPTEAPKRAAPATAAATTAATTAHPGAPPIPPRPAQPARAGVPSATTPPRRPVTPAASPSRRRFGRGSLIAAAASILVVGIVVAIVIRVSGGNESTPAPAPNTVAESPNAQGDGASTPAPAATRAQRAQTNVAVLNGTTVTGLARGVANKLEGQGYTIGTITDASNQAQPQTKVGYSSDHRTEARDVAKIIKVPASQVVALSPDDATTAGPNAEVVVIVGQDAAK